MTIAAVMYNLCERLSNRGEIITRQRLLRQIKREGLAVSANTVASFLFSPIRRLRHPWLVRVKPGVYRLDRELAEKEFRDAWRRPGPHETGMDPEWRAAMEERFADMPEARAKLAELWKRVRREGKPYKVDFEWRDGWEKS
jgi:hypothetical protein